MKKAEVKLLQGNKWQVKRELILKKERHIYLSYTSPPVRKQRSLW